MFASGKTARNAENSGVVWTAVPSACGYCSSRKLRMPASAGGLRVKARSSVASMESEADFNMSSAMRIPRVAMFLGPAAMLPCLPQRHRNYIL